jgi:hypothetical protein
MSQIYENGTTNHKGTEQLGLPLSPRSTPPSLLHRRKIALEDSKKFHKAEIAHLQQLLDNFYKIISATKTRIKDTSLSLKQVERSIINVKEEEMGIQAERNAHNSVNDVVYNIAEAALSPANSIATEWRGCACSSHQEIYKGWLKHNAELTIAQCMRTCMYCGSNFRGASELRKHIKRARYARRNLFVKRETRGRYSSTTPA